MFFKLKEKIIKPISIIDISFCIFLLTALNLLVSKSFNFWGNKDFWHSIHLLSYSMLFVWCFLSLIKKTFQKFTFYGFFFLFVLFNPDKLKLIFHKIFLFTHVYNLLGIENSSFINPNFVWITLIFIFFLIVGIFYFYSLYKVGFRKSYYLFFPFVSITVLLSLTLLFHDTLIKEGLIKVEKEICANSIINISKQGIDALNCKVNTCAIVRSDESFILISGDNNLIQKNTFNISKVLNDPNHKSFYAVNGFELYSACYGYYSKTNEVLMSIDNSNFPIRFLQTELGFHRLMGIACLVWFYLLLYHQLLILNRNKKI